MTKITIRSITSDDYDTLRELLLNEGYPEEEHMYCVPDTATYILSINGDICGFFTYRLEHGLPHLRHLCVSEKYRSPWMARRTIQAFRVVARLLGHDQAIIHSPNDIIDKFVRYYFKTQPYATSNNYQYYLVNL